GLERAGGGGGRGTAGGRVPVKKKKERTLAIEKERDYKEGGVLQSQDARAQHIARVLKVVLQLLSNVAAVIQCLFFKAEDGIRDSSVTGVQTCALPIFATADVRMIGRIATPSMHDHLLDRA